MILATHCESQALNEQIDRAGMKRVPIEYAYPDPADLTAMTDLIQRTHPAWIVLDGYHFSSDYQRALQESAGRLLVIDDLLHQHEYPADFVLNPNLHAETIRYPLSGNGKTLCGLRYALLRPEFDEWLDWRRLVEQRARRILVTMGGSDPDNVTSRVIAALATWRGQGFEIKVVVGPANAYSAEIQESLGRAITAGAREIGPKFTVLVAPPDMPSLMAWADIAISAAGGTAIELAYMQLPTLALAIADNQRQGAQAFARAGTLIDLGTPDRLSPHSLACAVRHLADSPTLRARMAVAGRRLVDGDGVRRVVNTLWNTIP